MLVHRRVTPHEICMKSAGSHFTPGWRGALGELCLAKEHNEVDPGQGSYPNHYIWSPERKPLATTPLLFTRYAIKNETMTCDNDVIRSL